MKLLPFYLLALLGTNAHATSFGVGMHFNERPAHHGGWHREYERHSHLGFEITTPRPTHHHHHDWDHRWNDWRSDDDFVTTWPLTREPRFEFLVEPRRPAPAPAPAPRPSFATQVEEDEEPVELEVNSEPEAPSAENPVLHYCASARAYYPAVRNCAEGWERQKGTRVQ